MVRFILFALLAIVLVLVAFVFSQNPDWRATFEVLGYRLSIHMGFLFFAGLIALWLFGWVYFAIRRTLAMPAEMAKNARISRQNRGYKALTQGLVALAAGDPDEADKQARRANKLLEETPATMLLTAQAAQLNGDEESAAKYFEEMTKNEETAFLGLRGKTMQALAKGDRKEVQALLDRARKIKPNAPWILETEYELGLQTGQLEGAQRAVKRLASRRLLSSSDAKNRLALTETDLAFQAAEKGAWRQAADHAKRALADDPTFIPARSLSARSNLELGNARKAKEQAVEAWRHRPTAGAATTYLRAWAPQDIASKRTAIAELIQANPNALFSQYLRAEAAIESGDYGIAEDAVADLPETSASVGVNALRLRLDAMKEGGKDPSPTPLDGHSLPVEPQVCSNCGTEHDRWRAVCTDCGSSGTVGLPTKAPVAPKMLPAT